MGSEKLPQNTHSPTTYWHSITSQNTLNLQQQHWKLRVSHKQTMRTLQISHNWHQMKVLHSNWSYSMPISEHYTQYCTYERSWSSTVSIPTGLQDTQSKVQIPVGEFFFLHNIHTSSVVNPAPYSMGTNVLSWGRRGWGVKLTTTSTQGVDKEN
jgi:hypothetical protein